jgi:hypothetical protein
MPDPASMAPAIAAWRAAGMPDSGIVGILYNINEERGFNPAHRVAFMPNSMRNADLSMAVTVNSCGFDTYNSTFGRTSPLGRCCRKRFFWQVKVPRTHPSSASGFTEPDAVKLLNITAPPVITNSG